MQKNALGALLERRINTQMYDKLCSHSLWEDTENLLLGLRLFIQSFTHVLVVKSSLRARLLLIFPLLSSSGAVHIHPPCLSWGAQVWPYWGWPNEPDVILFETDQARPRDTEIWSRHGVQGMAYMCEKLNRCIISHISTSALCFWLAS